MKKVSSTATANDLCRSHQVWLPVETGDVAVVQEKLDCIDALHKVLDFITSARFSTLRTLEENSQLYYLKMRSCVTSQKQQKSELETGMVHSMLLGAPS